MSLIALFCATQFCDPCRFPGKEVALTPTGSQTDSLSGGRDDATTRNYSGAGRKTSSRRK